MCGFFIQEVILSGLYIAEAAKLLRNSTRRDGKKFFIQLLGINVVIIIMDVGLLATEAASLYLYQTVIKGSIYSIKLKLEFAILGKLINFVGQSGPNAADEQRWRQASAAFMGSQNDGILETKAGGKERVHSTSLSAGAPGDVTELVYLSNIKTDTGHANHVSRWSTEEAGTEVGAQQRRRSRRNNIQTRRGVTDDDVEMARFQHVEDAKLPEEEDADDSDTSPATRVEYV